MKRRGFLIGGGRAALALGIMGTIRPGGVGAAGAGAGAATPFARLRDRYFLRVLQLNPVTSTYLGGDGWSPALADANGRLRDWRPEALAAEVAFYHEVQRELAAIPEATLRGSERVDGRVLEAQLRFILHQLEELQYQQRAVDTYVAEPFRGVDWQIQQLRDEGHGLLGTPQEWALVLARVRAVPAYVAAAQANLRAGKAAGNRPDRRMVQKDGIEGSRSEAEYFATTLAKQAREYIGARGFGPALLRDLEAAGAAAAQAFTGFADFLARELPDDGVDRYAVGEAEYDWRLRHNLGERRTAAELWEYGAAEVARYRAAMEETAARVAGEAGWSIPFGSPAEQAAGVRAVMDRLSRDAPRDDAEMLRWYVEAGRRAVAYGREHDLFDIPTEYRLDVTPTPPVLRATIDAAYYPAPPFKQSGVGRFYLTPTGNDPAALAANNRASIADTAVHEGFPGHDWHYQYMRQHAAEISDIRWLTPGAVEDSSSMWEDSMASEGWGLYAEELMAEPAPGRPDGFYTAAEHLYELQGQMLRAVRVRVDTGLHTGRMSFDDAVDYYSANVDFLPGARARAATEPAARASLEGAERAIYRYSKWPTQAITYYLGKNAIVELREAYRRQQGAKYSAKAFHQRFLRMGTIPVAYFRSEFLGGEV